MALKVAVTGAAGQISYSLVTLIARGDMFGPNQHVILHLLEVPPVMPALEGVVMELYDCAYPLLDKVVATTDAKEAFTDIDVALLVGAMPRREGMERKDLLKANSKIFEVQGKLLNEVAKKTVKVLVVGNPANTNCAICSACAPSIPRENFSALTRLDHNRAISQIACRVGLPVTNVKNAIIWGNHSSTQVPDVRHAKVATPSGDTTAPAIVNDDNWLKGDFLKTVQTRGAAIISARKASSAMSAAKAIVDHMRDWVHGTPEGTWVSMAVFGGKYGIPDSVIYSYPVTCKNGQWSIVEGLDIDSWTRDKMELTLKELQEEYATAVAFLSNE